ncbi:hypothetical protein GR160_11900 [Flavobacterium sp. Sd200]|uniref:hypothetical protein n=1 Tax=Flavobacterium sp. Sd200 TaxID=2692211 RepID=UPI001371BAB4|nr:hypothetical protein [Flavobacterium sp. Sd200]MXN91927.1 hypothetical protein [Flavobacterium sp. Sd200]
MRKIHVGFLLSYDYEKLKLSIPPVYKEADRIFIAGDENYLTWSGNKFEVDPSFFEWIEEFDTENKIEFYRDNFYIPTLTPIQNDTRERHMLSLKMGIGNWLVQVDSDEYFVDFVGFAKELRKRNSFLDDPEKNPVQISGFHIDIYKYVDGGILYVKNTCKALFATNYPNYKQARQTRERIIYTDAFTFHESLSRSEADLENKINNWGHRDEVNPEFLSKWKRANKDNYQEIKDVFYLNGTQWKELGYLPVTNMEDIKRHFAQTKEMEISKTFLLKKNFGQWFKHLFKGGKHEFEKYF